MGPLPLFLAGERLPRWPSCLGRQDLGRLYTRQENVRRRLDGLVQGLAVFGSWRQKRMR